jgi:REP element-mobilizing transposase RayT
MDGRLVSITTPKDLPHWTTENGTYFITYRLADSLPHPVQRRNKRVPEWRRMDRALDRGYGSAILKTPKLAAVIEENLRHFDQKRYSLCAWCVMPNHVHVIARVFRTDVSRVVHGWKSFTATRINAITGRSGPLWQRDYFDYLIRDDNDLARLCRYVTLNPEKARMRDWPFVWRTPEIPVAF